MLHKMGNGIDISHVSFIYKDGTIGLSDIHVSIRPGSFVGIVGSNGSGKSTLTYCLNGIIPHAVEGKLSGDITIDGESVKKRDIRFLSQKVGMVFQNPEFSLFNLTVAEEIEFPLKNFHHPRSERVIAESLKTVGLEGYQGRDPQTLSFGQKQKVAIASVLALKTPYLILDEPSSMLDHRSSVDVYRILKKLNAIGTTIIVVEHDTDFLWDYSDTCLILDRGNLVSQGAARKILSEKKLLNSLGIKIPK